MRWIIVNKVHTLLKSHSKERLSRQWACGRELGSTLWGTLCCEHIWQEQPTLRSQLVQTQKQGCWPLTETLLQKHRVTKAAALFCLQEEANNLSSSLLKSYGACKRPRQLVMFVNSRTTFLESSDKQRLESLPPLPLPETEANPQHKREYKKRGYRT